MDVWQSYLTEHKGKEPRNAFDLVNFSRSTDSTLTFHQAKQLYQQRSSSSNHNLLINNNSSHNALIDEDNEPPLIHRDRLDTDESIDDAPILKSPKFSTSRNNSSRKLKIGPSRHSKPRRTSGQSKHSKQSSKDSNLSSKHSKTNSKSSKNKFGVDATKFNMDDILKESDDHNLDNVEIRNIYKSDSTSFDVNKLTDVDLALQEDADMDIDIKMLDIPENLHEDEQDEEDEEERSSNRSRSKHSKHSRSRHSRSRHNSKHSKRKGEDEEDEHSDLEQRKGTNPNQHESRPKLRGKQHSRKKNASTPIALSIQKPQFSPIPKSSQAANGSTSIKNRIKAKSQSLFRRKKSRQEEVQKESEQHIEKKTEDTHSNGIMSKLKEKKKRASINKMKKSRSNMNVSTHNKPNAKSKAAIPANNSYSFKDRIKSLRVNTSFKAATGGSPTSSESESSSSSSSDSSSSSTSSSHTASDSAPSPLSKQRNEQQKQRKSEKQHRKDLHHIHKNLSQEIKEDQEESTESEDDGDDDAVLRLHKLSKQHQAGKVRHKRVQSAKHESKESRATHKKSNQSHQLHSNIRPSAGKRKPKPKSVKIKIHKTSHSHNDTSPKEERRKSSKARLRDEPPNKKSYRSSSADPSALMNGHHRPPRPPRRRKVKPPPSKNMKAKQNSKPRRSRDLTAAAQANGQYVANGDEHGDEEEDRGNVRRNNLKNDTKATRHHSYMHRSRSPVRAKRQSASQSKKKKGRANSDVLGGGGSSPIHHNRAAGNTYKLGRIHASAEDKHKEREPGRKRRKSKEHRERPAQHRHHSYNDHEEHEKKQHRRQHKRSASSNNSHTTGSRSRSSDTEDGHKGHRHRHHTNGHTLDSPDTRGLATPLNRKVFRIGDVVEVSLKIGDTRKTDLARVRYHGYTALDDKHEFYGIECFKFQFNSHKIGGRIVNDGSINGKTLFAVKKPGYGTFVKSKGIRSKKALWSLKRSKNALKLRTFEADVFINAAKYGSVKVVKHLFKVLIATTPRQMDSKSTTPTGTKRNSRSGSNGFYSKSGYYNPNVLNVDMVPVSVMQTVQTGFGYAVLNNHTKIVKIILSHCGSNHVSKYHQQQQQAAKLRRVSKNKSKSMIHLSGFNDHNGGKNHTRLATSTAIATTDGGIAIGDGAAAASSASDDTEDDALTDDEVDDDDEDTNVEETDDDVEPTMFELSKIPLLQSGGSKFYTADLFDLVCEQRNFRMLRLLIQFDSWPLLSPNSRGLHGVFCRKGYLKWIRYLLTLFPYIINMPLIHNDINSTMIHTSIIYDRVDYVKYLLNNFGSSMQFEFDKFVDEKQHQINLPIPILLLAVQNINMKNMSSSIEIIEILLQKGADVNWSPKVSLKQQEHLLMKNNVTHNDHIEFDFDPEYHEHKLLYYSFQHPNAIKTPLTSDVAGSPKNVTKSKSRKNTAKSRTAPSSPIMNTPSNKNTMVFGSMLAGLVHKFVNTYNQIAYHLNKNAKYGKKYAMQHLSDILALFMLYGVDFERMEFQHVWMEYDYFSLRWNVNNFPYNMCTTKDQFIFLQKVFKKALKKYPMKLLQAIQGIFDNEYLYWFDEDLSLYIDELMDIFEQYIIPYSIYDALIFESMHYYAPYTPEVSSPESADFVFAYQRSPQVE